MFMKLEQECLDRSESIEQLSEKRELMVSLMDGKENPRCRSPSGWGSRRREKHWSYWDVSTSWESWIGNESSKDFTRDGAVKGRRSFFRGH